MASGQGLHSPNHAAANGKENDKRMKPSSMCFLRGLGLGFRVSGMCFRVKGLGPLKNIRRSKHAQRALQGNTTNTESSPHKMPEVFQNSWFTLESYRRGKYSSFQVVEVSGDVDP